MKRFLIGVIIFIIVVITAIFYFVDIYLQKKEIKTIVISFKNKKEILYLKMFSGEETISISNNRKMYKGEDKTQNNIVINGAEALFYKVSSDTLYIIYPGEKSAISNLQTNIYIIEKSIDNVEFYNFWDNYKKMGYEKFPN